MDWVVLMKVVPDVEQVRFDAARGLMVREGVELFLNPFDQRALRLALDQRTPGESVTVVSMGPRSTLPALRETVALGADRAILITDPALAGSDTLVTSRTLARAVESLGAPMVVAGQWSTDSDTGQVPPQVAAMLGRPIVTEARRLVRGPDGGLEVEADTPDGWARYRVRPPVVVSVGEKITKIRKLLPAEVAASSVLPVEEWDIARLGLDRSEVGLSASPTRVERLIDAAPGRTPVLFTDGDLSGRVEAAVRAIHGRSRSPSGRSTAAPGKSSGTGAFIVVVSDEEGRLSHDGLAMVQGVLQELPGIRVEALWLGPSLAPDGPAALAACGATRLWHARSRSSAIDPTMLTSALARVLDGTPEAVGVGVVSERFGREAASALAAARALGMTGDATGCSWGPGPIPRFHKPAFGGREVALIATRSGPAVASFRPGAFPSPTPGAARTLERSEFDVAAGPRAVDRVASGRELDGSWGDLSSSPRVIVAGQGVGSPEGVQRLRELARSCGAAVGATRRVVDLGWAPRQLQVGTTGRSIAPDLAVLVGVGGSFNHLAGLRRAGTLLAINRDPGAPVFGRVDLGIVGEWAPALEELTRRLGPSAGAGPATP